MSDGAEAAGSESETDAVRTDPGIGLLSTSALLDAIDARLRRVDGAHSGLICVGLDDTSTINDAFGYSSGSHLLLRAAERLGAIGAPVTALGRMGPDAFGLLLTGIGPGEEEARAACLDVADRIVQALSAAIHLDNGIVIQADASIGFVVFSPHACPRVLQSADPLGDEVFASAEIARKRAQRSFVHPCVLEFEPKMITAAQDHVTLISDLRNGVSRDELRLFAQPIVAADRHPIGFEALLRWESPTRGLVMPAEFIPLAEQTGLIIDLGQWVLDRACEALEEWAGNARLRAATLSINLSERQLRPGNFAATVRRALGAHPAPEGRLNIEMTESMLHTDLENSASTLEALSGLHVDVLLDDFGTGYSSLSYLRELPVQGIKIDRSFVRQLGEGSDREAIVRTIVELAKVLRLQVVAEGVETEQQFQALQRLGVDAFQGFLFGRPQPIEEAAGVAERLEVSRSA